MRIEFDFLAVLAQWPLLATGVLWTLGLTAISAVIGLSIGTLCAWGRNPSLLTILRFRRSSLPRSLSSLYPS